MGNQIRDDHMINLYASTDVHAVLATLVLAAVWLMYAIDRKRGEKDGEQKIPTSCWNNK